MKFIAEIDVMPLKSLLDPQGKAVSASMGNVGLAEIKNVRIGKHITLEIEAESKEAASTKVDEACKKMLCNQIMESYEVTLEEI
jgi:phosphoribosylformylglycinamidine synthase subunit PurS